MVLCFDERRFFDDLDGMNESFALGRRSVVKLWEALIESKKQEIARRTPADALYLLSL